MPSGWLRGSIYWVLLFWDRFSVSKTIISEAQEHFLVSAGPRHTPSFGGLGLNRSLRFRVHRLSGFRGNSLASKK